MEVNDCTEGGTLGSVKAQRASRWAMKMLLTEYETIENCLCDWAMRFDYLSIARSSALRLAVGNGK